jgi:surface protein
MFNGAKAFNQPLQQLRVPNVANMARMFGGAEALNQDIGDWDVGSVLNMKGWLQ